MIKRSIVTLLRDPALDWSMGVFNSAETALWITPILQGNPLSAPPFIVTNSGYEIYNEADRFMARGRKLPAPRKKRY